MAHAATFCGMCQNLLRHVPQLFTACATTLWGMYHNFYGMCHNFSGHVPQVFEAYATTFRGIKNCTKNKEHCTSSPFIFKQMHKMRFLLIDLFFLFNLYSVILNCIPQYQVPVLYSLIHRLVVQYIAIGARCLGLIRLIK